MNETLYVMSKTDDPAFNLAAEEVFMKKHNTNIIFLYINSSSIIVGKHQNTLAEINLPYLEENNIPVYRRLSGGGTVYHDSGNINFCIIENGEPGKLVDFVKATTPVVEALKNLGIDARHGERNDLLAGHKKISGNACHVYKNRTMHHGTLLYNANISHLTGALKNNNENFRDKSVKSVRSEVINIASLRQSSQNAEDFMQSIGGYLQKVYGARKYEISEADQKEIDKLAREKYQTWEWNYGYSPVYEFSKRYKSGEYMFSSKLKVEKGVITEFILRTNHPEQSSLKEASQKMLGSYHEKKQIRQLLSDQQEEVAKGILQSMF